VRESDERYAIAASAGDEGLWDWNLEKNEIYFSPRWKVMVGCGEEEIGDSPDEWLKRVHSKDLGRLLGRLSDHLHRGADRFESEHRILHKDGGYRWVLARGIAVRQDSGNAVRLVGWLTDITDRKRNEDRLKHDAWHDALTDLPNRAYFHGQLQRAATRSYGRPHQCFALLYLDVDNFKQLNDGMGHSVGDQVLIAIANRLKNSVRPGDTIARIGGDEFAILLARLGDEREAGHIAERIQKALALPVKIGANEHSISVSIGVALSSLSHDKPGDFLRDADAAMYQAKADGTGCLKRAAAGAGLPRILLGMTSRGLWIEVNSASPINRSLPFRRAASPVVRRSFGGNTNRRGRCQPMTSSSPPNSKGSRPSSMPGCSNKRARR